MGQILDFIKDSGMTITAVSKKIKKSRQAIYDADEVNDSEMFDLIKSVLGMQKSKFQESEVTQYLLKRIEQLEEENRLLRVQFSKISGASAKIEKLKE